MKKSWQGEKVLNRGGVLGPNERKKEAQRKARKESEV